MNRLLTALLALIAALAATTSQQLYAAGQPLLIPGKQSLYQRVLAVPGSRLHAEPGGAVGEPVTPFTAFYVYAREQADGNDWLQVGTDRHGGVRGWLKGAGAIDWTQGLTVAFREAVGRDRALLYRDAASVRDLAKTRDMARYGELYRSAEAGEKRDDSPVVAIQPPGKLDIKEDFYLVPILRHEDL